MKNNLLFLSDKLDLLAGEKLELLGDVYAVAKGTTKQLKDTFAFSIDEALEKEDEVNCVLIDVDIFDKLSGMPEVAKHLKLNYSNIRVIFMGSFLSSQQAKKYLKQTASFGVYDFIIPMQDLTDEIALQLVQEAIDKPKNLVDVVDYIEYVDEAVTALVHKNKDVKKRVYAISSKPEFVKLFKDKDLEMEVTLAGHRDKDTNSLNDIKLLNLDYIVLDNPTAEEINNLSGVISILQNPIEIIAAYDAVDLYRESFTTQNLRFLYADSEEFVRKISNTISRSKNTATDNMLNGKVITFINSKGGSGNTTVSSLVANELAGHKDLNLKVCIVDFRLFPGTMNVKYRINEPTKNIYSFMKDCIKNKNEKYNMNYWKNSILDYIEYIKASKVSVLPTTYVEFQEYCDFKASEEDTVFALQYTIDCLKENFDIVILDTDFYSNAFDIAVLNSNRIFLTSELNVSNLWTIKVSMRQLLSDLYPNIQDKINLIFNKEDIKKNSYHYSNYNEIKKLWNGKYSMFLVGYDKNIVKAEEKLEKKVSLSKPVKKQIDEICNLIVPAFKTK